MGKRKTAQEREGHIPLPQLQKMLGKFVEYQLKNSSMEENAVAGGTLTAAAAHLLGNSKMAAAHFEYLAQKYRALSEENN